MTEPGGTGAKVAACEAEQPAQEKTWSLQAAKSLLLQHKVYDGLEKEQEEVWSSEMGPFAKPAHNWVGHIEYGDTCNFQTPLEFRDASTKIRISIPKRNTQPAAYAHCFPLKL
ncbi:hypothetical protein EK904_004832, partial [Melospiza melodia maxima]